MSILDQLSLKEQQRAFNVYRETHHTGGPRGEEVYSASGTPKAAARTPRGEIARGVYREMRLCSSRTHDEDSTPFASSQLTITNPADANGDHPRGLWTSGVPVCPPCEQRIMDGLPFGYVVIERTYPPLCECGINVSMWGESCGEC